MILDTRLRVKEQVKERLCLEIGTMLFVRRILFSTCLSHTLTSKLMVTVFR